ncbi:MAG: aldo/keto reductase [Cyclobacteriaceae bacterium]
MNTDNIVENKPSYSSDYKKSPKFENGPRLVLGTSGLGGVWGGVQTHESIDAILYALEVGVGAFDTAPSYSEAESVLGGALREWTGARPFVSTKVGRLKAASAHEFKLDYSSDGMRRSVENSLKTIGVDHVDLLFLHEPQLVEKEEIPRILDVLVQFKEEGLINKIGIGGNLTDNFRPHMGKGKFEVISGFLKMNACNLDAFRDDVSFIKEQGLAYYNASILHFGLMGNRLSTYKENFDQESDWLQKRDISVAEDIQKLAEENNMSFSVLAQRYAFGIAEADRIVAGAKNIDQIKRTLSDWEQGPLSEELFNDVTQIIFKHY